MPIVHYYDPAQLAGDLAQNAGNFRTGQILDQNNFRNQQAAQEQARYQQNFAAQQAAQMFSQDQQQKSFAEQQREFNARQQQQQQLAAYQAAQEQAARAQAYQQQQSLRANDQSFDVQKLQYQAGTQQDLERMRLDAEDTRQRNLFGQQTRLKTMDEQRQMDLLNAKDQLQSNTADDLMQWLDFQHDTGYMDDATYNEYMIRVQAGSKNFPMSFDQFSQRQDVQQQNRQALQDDRQAFQGDQNQQSRELRAATTQAVAGRSDSVQGNIANRARSRDAKAYWQAAADAAKVKLYAASKLGDDTLTAAAQQEYDAAVNQLRAFLAPATQPTAEYAPQQPTTQPAPTSQPAQNAEPVKIDAYGRQWIFTGNYDPSGKAIYMRQGS